MLHGVASYTKMLTLLETCSARRLLDLILRYAPNKVKRGFAPAVCGQLPTLRGARGQAPCTPKIAPFRLPSSVTLFCGRSSHKIVFLKRTSFRSPYTPNAVYLQGFYHFLRCLQTHTQGNNLAWCSWSFRGVLLVTDEAHAVPAPSVGNCPLSFSRSDRCNNA